MSKGPVPNDIIAGGPSSSYAVAPMPFRITNCNTSGLPKRAMSAASKRPQTGKGQARTPQITTAAYGQDAVSFVRSMRAALASATIKRAPSA